MFYLQQKLKSVFYIVPPNYEIQLPPSIANYKIRKRRQKQGEKGENFLSTCMLWLHHLACTYTHLYIHYATSHTFWQKKLLLHEHLTYLLRVYELLKTPVRAVPSMRWSLTTKCQDLAQTTKQFSVFTRWSVIRFLREPRMGNPIFVFLFIK